MPRLWTKPNDIDKVLSAYLDGELPPHEARRLEQRLAQDAELWARLDGLRQTVLALRNLPTLDVPRNFILSPTMVKEPKRQPRRRPARRLSLALSWATALAALLLVVVLAGDLWLLAPAGSGPTESPASLAKGAEPGEAAQTGETIALAPTLEREEATVGPEGPVEPTVPNVAAADASSEAELPQPEMVPMTPEMAEAPSATEGEGQMTQPMMVTGPATVTVLPPPAPMVTAAVAVTPGRDLLEAPPEGPVEMPAELAEAPVPPTEPAVAADVPSPPTPTVVPASPTSPSEPTATTAVAAAPQTDWGATEAAETERATRAATEESDRDWLRLVEVGLGLLIVGLLIATLIVRQRGL